MEEDNAFDISWILNDAANRKKPMQGNFIPNSYQGNKDIGVDLSFYSNGGKPTFNSTIEDLLKLSMMKGDKNPYNAPTSFKPAAASFDPEKPYLYNAAPEGLNDGEITLEQHRIADDLFYNNRLDEIFDMITYFEGGHFENGYSFTHPDPIYGSSKPTNAGQTKSGLSREGRIYLANKGYSLDDVFKIGGKLKKEDADNLRKIYIYNSRQFLTQTYKDFDLMPFEIKAMLHDLHYNMGGKSLAQFKNMNAAINAGDWKTAAKELKDSKYFNQTGRRSQRHYDMLMEF